MTFRHFLHLGVSGTRIPTFVEDTATAQFCVTHLAEGRRTLQHLCGQKCAAGVPQVNVKYVSL